MRRRLGSQDRDLVELLLDCLDRPARIREQRTRIGNRYFRTQFGDARFYEWLVTVGVTPRKSLSLAAIDVPAEHGLSLTRGLLDGDGSIGNHVYRAERHGRPGYSWEYLCVAFSSSSEAHVRWLRQLLGANLAIHGSVGRTERLGRAPAFQLRYGKRASIVLLRALYTDPRAPALSRKRAIWHEYVQRHCVGVDPAG